VTASPILGQSSRDVVQAGVELSAWLGKAGELASAIDHSAHDDRILFDSVEDQPTLNRQGTHTARNVRSEPADERVSGH
jgi:hypothetical protein